jgi:hypothetical protein
MKAYQMPNQEYVIVKMPACYGELTEEYAKFAQNCYILMGYLLRRTILDGFDLLLLFMFQGKILPEVAALAKYAIMNNIKLAFVYSHCDQTLQYLFKDTKNASDREREKQRLVQDCRCFFLFSWRFYDLVTKNQESQLLSCEKLPEDFKLFNGLKAFFVSAPATRAVIEKSMGMPYDKQAMMCAMPDDHYFVQRVTDMLNDTK